MGLSKEAGVSFLNCSKDRGKFLCMLHWFRYQTAKGSCINMLIPMTAP